MPSTMPPGAEKMLAGRYIACLGTHNEDGSIHLTAVWYLYEDGGLYVGTSSRSRKGRNVAARPKATLMVDSRKPATERGLVAICTANIGEGASFRHKSVDAKYERKACDRHLRYDSQGCSQGDKSGTGNSRGSFRSEHRDN